mmetsp:Transcript_11352/g.36293  ORF Transcript_11352/g.36293 Transcript_11352/m.36293 type:complete len:225 (-) Transcript_11352:86-760(-)
MRRPSGCTPWPRTACSLPLAGAAAAIEEPRDASAAVHSPPLPRASPHHAHRILCCCDARRRLRPQIGRSNCDHICSADERRRQTAQEPHFVNLPPPPTPKTHHAVPAPSPACASHTGPACVSQVGSSRMSARKVAAANNSKDGDIVDRAGSVRRVAFLHVPKCGTALANALLHYACAGLEPTVGFSLVLGPSPECVDSLCGSRQRTALCEQAQLLRHSSVLAAK